AMLRKLFLEPYRGQVAHQRANTWHPLTARLAKTQSVVVIEDLHTAGMLQNPHLAQAISEVGFHEFRRQLADTARWYGCRVIVAERWFGPSRTCSECGWRDETPDADAGRPHVRLSPS